MEVEINESYQKAWAEASGYNQGPTCQCGASKVHAKEPNLEYLHQPYCPLYLDPNWIQNLKKEIKYE